MLNRLFTPAVAVSAALVVLFAAVDSHAQPARFVGEVVEDAEMRAGAGRTFYVVGELKKGATVTVDELFFNWFKIVPPEGTYSYISKAFVNAQGDGKAGVVNADRGAAVKAASVNGPGESYRRQLDLSKGDVVQIVGDEGSFYKIVPPTGAFVFVAPGAIKPISDVVVTPGAPTAPAPEPTAPAVPVTPEPAAPVTPVAPTTPETPVQPAPSVATPQQPAPEAPAAPAVTVPEPAAMPAPLVALEDRIINASKLPLEQQPLNELIADLKALDENPATTPGDRALIQGRLRQLERNLALQQTLAEIAAVQQRIRDRQTAEAAEEVARRNRPRDRSSYQAVGLLVASTVYDGITLPRLLRLVEPGSMRTILYVRPSRTVDPFATLGRVVGVIGQSQYDPALKMSVMDVEIIDMLEPTGTAPPPAVEPTPAPAEATQAAPAEPAAPEPSK